ncbi:hypothetical protein E3N88_10192 [Mikania micrantha]|uniref:Uncharacterized protein n=1 Tax=Mikania micrantha TaxID=192012 RepID=A0A5N6P9T4_9ASTR|nr:hypothetical protein E3N88_10192 [Mikania micrantha]
MKALGSHGGIEVNRVHCNLITRVKPSEEEMKVLRKFDSECVWVKEEKIQKKKVFENKQHVKRLVKKASSSDDEFYDNFSSKQFPKQNVNSNSFWKFRHRSDDKFLVRKDEYLEDGSSSNSSKLNGRRLFRKAQHRNGGSHPFWY